jgi:hypothetical protein
VRGNWFLTGQFSKSIDAHVQGLFLIGQLPRTLQFSNRAVFGSVIRIQHLVGLPVLIQGGIVVWSTWRGLGKAFEVRA